jgi:alkylation response protein AidB-like acyl-CoA dehydrogenase
VTLLLPTEEQLAIASGVAKFLNEEFPLDRFRSSRAPERERWSSLVQIGVVGISLAESEGGMGLSLIEEVLVCRELGRHLVSPALIGCALAPHVAARAGCVALRDALLAGERRVGIAMTQAPDGIRIIDGDNGMALLVERNSLRLIDCGAYARSLACIDETLDLSSAPLSASGLASAEDKDLVLAAQLLAAAMLCGQLEATRDMAADYARTRVQFGRPIGAYQAIKHRCADIALAAELCWSQTLHAADALSSGAEDAEFHVRTAKLLAGDEALKASRFNIQAHGGIGFTEEAHAHRLMKRAHVLHQLFGDPRLVRPCLLDLPLAI